MRFSGVFLAALIGISIPGFVLADEPQNKSTRLGQQEAHAGFADKTINWANGKGASYYAPNGTMLVKYFGVGGTLEGKWKISEDGVLCLKLRKWYKEEYYCNWAVYRNGDRVSTYDIAKKKKIMTPAKDFSDGNAL